VNSRKSISTILHIPGPMSHEEGLMTGTAEEAQSL
jgi:hypothetical protein